MNELMRFKLFFFNNKNSIFKSKSLNNFMGREDPIEFYKYYIRVC
jgi:hypothetical protein